MKQELIQILKDLPLAALAVVLNTICGIAILMLAITAMERAKMVGMCIDDKGHIQFDAPPKP